jgi:hypothetical protein
MLSNERREVCPGVWHSNEKRRLDPYGSLEYCIGSGDDFVCFEFGLQKSGRVLRIESVLNSETGHFIDRFHDPILIDLAVVSLTDLKEAIIDEIDSALDWCMENEVKHTKAGWNQDPFYLYRAIMCYLFFLGRIALDGKGREEWHRFGSRQQRMGGKRINKFTELGPE